VKSVAVVGASARPVRPSHLVAQYLRDKGYAVFPVNPGIAGKTLLGRPVYASLAEVPAPVDMVNVFRRTEAVPAVVEAALRLRPLPKAIWMQLGIRDDVAAARAEAAGIRVVMNRCPKIEYARLSGEIGWSGVNTRIRSSKRPTLASGRPGRALPGD
jgi:predicted CoA-binding protein